MSEAEGMSSGGQLLKQMRLAQGLDLEVLASMIKVTPAKLDALESGRYHELPDAAFTRALAMTVCRVLKADPAAVLASMPQAQRVSLSASEPSQVPFKARRARLNLDVPAALPWRELMSSRWMVPAGVLLAAAALYFLPEDLGSLLPTGEPDQAAAAVAASAPELEMPEPVAASAPEALVEPVDAASAPLDVAASTAGAALTGSSPVQASALAPAGYTPSGSALVLNVTESSWVEVRDADGVKVLSRHVTPGETVGVDGSAPLSVKVGNVAGVSMVYKGQAVDLSGFTKSNVARLELK